MLSCIPIHTINNEAIALYEIHYEAKVALEEKDCMKACSLSIDKSPRESERRAGVERSQEASRIYKKTVFNGTAAYG